MVSSQPAWQISAQERLHDAIPDIKKAKDICNAPSVSVGVLFGGNNFTYSTGFRDVENGKMADKHTSYHIGSCAKIFTTAATGILVDEGDLSWHDTIQKHLPNFNPVEDPEIGKNATIMDVCRHSTGLANPNVVFMGPNGAPAIRTEEYVDMINDLPTKIEHRQRFRSWWYYSNAAYGLLGFVVKTVTGKEFSDFLRTRICDPLGLTHTLLTEDDVAGNSNLAHPYVKIGDSWEKINNGLTSRGHSHTLPFLGVRSSVQDILLFCDAVMDRYETEQAGPPSQKTPQAAVSWPKLLWGLGVRLGVGLGQALGLLHRPTVNPLREISSIWDWCWTRPHDDGFESNTAYMLGWLRTTIPSSVLSFLSYNSSPTKKEYVVGKGSTPRVLYGHSGCVNGSVATIYVVPECRVAIVALSNAADAGDASNTSAQILLQAVLDLKPKVDLLRSLEECRDIQLEKHQDMIKDWRRHRDASKYKCQPQQLLGTYRGLGASVIDVVESENSDSKLAVIFGKQEGSRCELEKFNRNSLSFLPLDHKEILKRAMIDWDYWTVGVFRFVREDENQQDSPVVGLRWKWDQYEDSTLWVKMTDDMSSKDYNAIVEKHEKFLKDPWAKDLIPENKKNGVCKENGSCKGIEKVRSHVDYQSTEANVVVV